MGDSNGEPELHLVPKYERTNKDILASGCTKYFLINLHPVEPWVILTPDGKSLQVWNYDDGSQVASWALPDVNDAGEAQFITQEDWIAVRRLRSLSIYDKQGSNLRCKKVLKDETDGTSTYSMAVYPTLPYLLAGFQQNDVFLWHCAWEWEKVILEGHSTWVWQVVFHPTEPHIFASVGGERSIKVWNLEKMSVIQTLEDGGQQQYIDEIGFGNGLHKSLLISLHKREKCVRVWDYESGVCMAKWEPHDQKRISAFFHPRLPCIFTAAEDGDIRVWSDSTYQQVSSYFCPWDGYLWKMQPCEKSNMLVLGGRGEFRVLQIMTRGEEKAKKELEKRGSLAARPRTEPGNEVADYLLELEKKIEHRVTKIELSCEKVVNELRAEHQEKERIQAERIERLEMVLTRFREEAVDGISLLECERDKLIERVNQLEHQ